MCRYDVSPCCRIAVFPPTACNCQEFDVWSIGVESTLRGQKTNTIPLSHTLALILRLSSLPRRCSSTTRTCPATPRAGRSQISWGRRDSTALFAIAVFSTTRLRSKTWKPASTRPGRSRRQVLRMSRHERRRTSTFLPTTMPLGASPCCCTLRRSVLSKRSNAFVGKMRRRFLRF